LTTILHSCGFSSVFIFNFLFLQGSLVFRYK
jgi:hypothetical protein